MEQDILLMVTKAKELIIRIQCYY